MANPNTVHEPSMEEILASIRQIISEDGGSSAPKIDGVVTGTPAQGMRSERTDQETIEDISEAVVEDEPRSGSEPDFARHLRHAAPEEIIEEPEYAPEPPRSATTAPHAATSSYEEEEPLLSKRSGEAVSGAFGALANTLLAHNHTRTLEDVVTEMLQPMLKQWLDDNLPAIVERKVQEEIERVSRGRR